MSKRVRGRTGVIVVIATLLVLAAPAVAAPIDKPLPAVPTVSAPPAQNATEHARLMGALKPSMRAKVTSAAATALGKISRTTSPTDAVKSTLPSLALGKASPDSIEAMLFVVMAETARQAEDELKSQMEKIREINRKKAAIRELIAKCNRDRGCLKSSRPPANMTKDEADKMVVAQLDGPDDDIDQTRMQLFLDRRKALLEAVANVIAKASAMRPSLVSSLD